MVRPSHRNSGSEQGRPLRSTYMGYKITVEPDFLLAELFGRETVEETQAFLRAIVRENGKHRRSGILILVRSSKPIFQVVPHRLIEYFEELSVASSYRIALVGDTRDLRMSHEYIELIAQQRKLNVRSFRDETAALQWLKHRRQLQERRQRNGRRDQQERRQQQQRRAQDERRSHQRRASQDAPSPA